MRARALHMCFPRLGISLTTRHNSVVFVELCGLFRRPSCLPDGLSGPPDRLSGPPDRLSGPERPSCLPNRLSGLPDRLSGPPEQPCLPNRLSGLPDRSRPTVLSSRAADCPVFPTDCPVLPSGRPVLPVAVLSSRPADRPSDRPLVDAPGIVL
jgi:hypothetical protein